MTDTPTRRLSCGHELPETEILSVAGQIAGARSGSHVRYRPPLGPQAQELLAAGWRKLDRKRWQAPDGRKVEGTARAWRKMQRAREEDA